jgi:Skp family chaperone for outer membrane proteins
MTHFLDMTPKQAGEAEKGMFFAWLDAQKAKEDAEKAEKLAKEEAEKQRKKEEALQRRMDSEREDLFVYLNDTVKEWGEKVVHQWIDEWFSLGINDD